MQFLKLGVFSRKSQDFPDRPSLTRALLQSKGEARMCAHGCIFPFQRGATP